MGTINTVPNFRSMRRRIFLLLLNKTIFEKFRKLELLREQNMKNMLVIRRNRFEIINYFSSFYLEVKGQLSHKPKLKY